MKTDKQLQQDVIDELKWEPSVQAAEIGVGVKSGIVTLSGKVCSYAEKQHAERAAQRVSGVEGMAVELKVKLVGSDERADGDIARAVKSVIEWSSTVPSGAIKVLVENGWVTLTGNVDWQYQRQGAADCVRYLLGVVGVSNQIAIKPTLSAGAVKADIEAALKRRATDDAKTVMVEVHGSDVTLTGTVHSWSERELALHSAWNAPGVCNVVDKITLIV